MKVAFFARLAGTVWRLRPKHKPRCRRLIGSISGAVCGDCEKSGEIALALKYAVNGGRWNGFFLPVIDSQPWAIYYIVGVFCVVLVVCQRGGGLVLGAFSTWRVH